MFNDAPVIECAVGAAVLEKRDGGRPLFLRERRGKTLVPRFPVRVLEGSRLTTSARLAFSLLSSSNAPASFVDEFVQHEALTAEPAWIVQEVDRFPTELHVGRSTTWTRHWTCHSATPTSLPSSRRTRFASVRPSFFAHASRAFRISGLTHVCTSLCSRRCFSVRCSALRVLLDDIRLALHNTPWRQRSRRSLRGSTRRCRSRSLCCISLPTVVRDFMQQNDFSSFAYSIESMFKTVVASGR